MRSNEWLATSLARGEKPYLLLKSVAVFGSLNRATKELKVTHKHASCALSLFEKTLGLTLVERKTGGPGGGGCSLTPDGKRFLVHYGQFRKEAQEAFDELFSPSPFREHAVFILAIGEEPHRLLTAITTFGSLHRAAKALHKCYPVAWHRINRFERIVGVTLVEGKVDGCRLTATAKRFVKHYEGVRTRLRERLGEVCGKARRGAATPRVPEVHEAFG